MLTRAQVAVVTATCFVLAAVVPLGAAAQADPKKEQAKQFFEAGKRFYEMQSWRPAIEQFKQAQALLPSPILDYNIGLCYEKLGKPRAAAKYYKRYLAGAPTADNRAEVENKIAALAAQIAAAPPAPPAPLPEPGAPPPAPLPDQADEAVPPAPPPPPPEGYYQYGQPYGGPPPPPLPPPEQPRRSLASQWWFWVALGAAAITVIAIIAVAADRQSHNDYYGAGARGLHDRPSRRGLSGRPLLLAPPNPTPVLFRF
jgi:tetratricopeptide (TPR) repeat protein